MTDCACGEPGWIDDAHTGAWRCLPCEMRRVEAAAKAQDDAKAAAFTPAEQLAEAFVRVMKRRQP